jgi:hypothetical protein
VCDRLATHPNDATASVKGVDLDELRRHGEAAIDACSHAEEAHP